MDRRRFLISAVTSPLAAFGQGEGPKGPPVEDRVERMTPGPEPTIAVCHAGYRPRTGRKIVVVRDVKSPRPTEFSLRPIDGQQGGTTKALTEVHGDLGTFLIGDFTEIERPGYYQINIGGARVPLREFGEKAVLSYTQWSGGERSVPFAIAEDAWRRTVPKAVSYIHAQRCGAEVPGVHPPCHLDDGRREDNRKHIEAVGGWHDAGDVRKGVAYTALMGVGLLKIYENLDPVPGDTPREALLDEVRHGNRYFLNMQDSDGKVFGGLGQNRWTDNIVGNADDRPLNPNRKPEGATSIFATLQALAARCYAKADPAYAKHCLEAGTRAFQTSKHRRPRWNTPGGRLRPANCIAQPASPSTRKKRSGLAGS